MSFDPSLPIYRSFRHRHKQAFGEGFNLVGLAGVAAAAMALLTPIPLLIGIVAEAAYLLFVPDTRWYMKRMEARFDAEVVKRREDLKAQVYPTVRPQIKEQFGRLETMRAQIGTQASKEETWFQEALRKLDFLMEKFLQFAAKEAQFSNYLISIYNGIYDDLPQELKRKAGKPPPIPTAPPQLSSYKSGANAPQSLVNPTEAWVKSMVGTIQEYYDLETADLAKQAEAEEVAANKNIMEKRSQILGRRKEFVARIGQILTNLGHQMMLMTDTFGLINDEIRARSPEQVLADIDEVVTQTTSLTQAIDEITPTDELVGTLSQSA